MLEVIISWMYIALICFLTGFGIWKLLSGIVKLHNPGFTTLIVTGIVAVTVYTSYFSIFGRIALTAQVLVLIFDALIIFRYHSEIFKMMIEYKKILFSWEGFFYILIVFFIAFFASRGTFHTDTNIYHAANIRIYEEVGLIKGMTNLQLNFGYNSSYLAFASFFSFGWLFGRPVHSTTGFLIMLFGIYACRHLKNIHINKSHLGDAACAAIWFYILVILTGSMSPATDYAAMLFTLYGIAAFIIAFENSADISVYAMLSVFMVFILTVKLSAGIMVIVALYPLVMLLRQRRGKEIAAYLVMGIIVLMPFFIRNYFISGWLIYPLAEIDIFNPDWKVPIETVKRDAALIKTYGRCLYNADYVDMPISRWLPVWFGKQQYYEKMLLYSFVCGSAITAVHELYTIITRKVCFQRLILYIAIWLSALMWFLEAPFIRYGLAFLLTMPLLAVGTYFTVRKKGFVHIVFGLCSLLVILLVTPYIDNYFQDLGVFIKHNVKADYYVLQEDYDNIPYDTQQVGSFTLTCPKMGDYNGYYNYPGTGYQGRLDVIEARGDNLRDGFRSKE